MTGEGEATSAHIAEELLCSHGPAQHHRPLIRVSMLNKAVTQQGRLLAPLNPATDNPRHGELSVIWVLNTSHPLSEQESWAIKLPPNYTLEGL